MSRPGLVQAGQLVGPASVRSVYALLPWPWWTLKAPPQNVPLWSRPRAPPASVIRTRPAVASIVVPTGRVEAAPSGTYRGAPGSITRTEPDAGLSVTEWPRTGGVAGGSDGFDGPVPGSVVPVPGSTGAAPVVNV